jgi:hypothetical protein
MSYRLNPRVGEKFWFSQMGGAGGANRGQVANREQTGLAANLPQTATGIMPVSSVPGAARLPVQEQSVTGVSHAGLALPAGEQCERGFA